MNEKIKIRSKALKKRNSFPADVRAARDRKIAERLESLEDFKKAHHVLFYYSVKGEAGTRGLIEKYLSVKQLYLPVIRGKSHFQAVPVKSPLNLNAGYENVPEPVDEAPSSVYDDRIEIIITPGVAFDKKGNRIGMGKGYYDRYFAQNHSALKIALAYEEQVLDYVPKDLYDVGVDWIVTDQNIYRCHS